MASGRPITTGDSGAFPAPNFGGVGSPSVISSRLSDDGGHDDGDEARAGTGGASRPNTSRSVDSRKNDSTAGTKRISTIAPKPDTWVSTSEGGSARSRTLMRGSHVPSLTPNAFFRPMSSQKLQAHRGAASKLTTIGQQLAVVEQPPLDDRATDIAGSVVPRLSTSSNPPLPFQGLGAHRDHHTHPNLPPSRGTENTDHDRITSEMSPTNGQYPTASLSDSAQPLRRSAPDDSRPGPITNKGYQDAGRSGNGPMKSPRSFRSSFRLSGRSNSGRQKRSTDRGAEKLSSGASSPTSNRRAGHGQTQPTSTQPGQSGKPGRVHEYFEGNTHFYLGGRWQNTMGRPINIATGICILLPCGLFFGFEAPWFWHNISPAVPIIFSYLAFICFSSFLHASISDPGVSCLALFSSSANSCTLTMVPDSAAKSTPVPSPGRKRRPSAAVPAHQRLDPGKVC